MDRSESVLKSRKWENLSKSKIKGWREEWISNAEESMISLDNLRERIYEADIFFAFQIFAVA